MFGLTVLYILIIFGILFIQFRKESIITEIFGPFQLVVSESIDQDNRPVYSNNFQLAATGITYSANETHPVILEKEDVSVPLVFAGYQEEENGVSLFFDNDVTLTWSTQDPDDAPYTIDAYLPEDAVSITLPYRLTATYTTADGESESNDSVILTTKDAEYELTAAVISETSLTLTPDIARLSYGYRTEEHIFTFDDILSSRLASSSSYDDTRLLIRGAMANALPKDGFTSVSEQAVAAWISEQASQGNLSQALSQIPDSIKEAKGHTYFTAPYFNTLASVVSTLRTKLMLVESQANGAVVTRDPAVLESEGLGLFLTTGTKTATLPVLRMLASLETETLTLSQTGALLQLYADLLPSRPASAAVLEPVIDLCTARLEQSSRLEDTLLFLYENEEPLTRMASARIGMALAKIGQIKEDVRLLRAGNMILNTALRETYTLTVEELAELYPLFETENSYYPHVVMLDDEEDEPVWAWTVAQNMTYSTDAAGTTEFTATFPVNGIHHMIITGIKPFSAIQIYSMYFRTDPRFETYNSSGYVYQADHGTLLMKFRQRAETETVILERQ